MTCVVKHVGPFQYKSVQYLDSLCQINCDFPHHRYALGASDVSARRSVTCTASERSSDLTRISPLQALQLWRTYAGHGPARDASTDTRPTTAAAWPVVAAAVVATAFTASVYQLAALCPIYRCRQLTLTSTAASKWRL